MRDERSPVGPDGESTLRHYLDVLWRRRWLALVPLVLLPLITFVASKRQAPAFEAVADVLVNRQEAATTSLIGQTPAFDDVGRAVDTQVQLSREPAFLERVVAAAGVPGVSASTLKVNSLAFPLADVVRFSVTQPERGRAATLATAYAEEFVKYRRELDTSGFAGALDSLESRLAKLEAEGKAGSPLHLRLADRQQQLESLRALNMSNVAVVDTPEAGDAEQVAPRPLRNTALAAALGLVAALVLVALAETLSVKPRSEEEVEELLAMPYLGRLEVPPDTVAGQLGDAGLAAADLVHALRANVERSAAERGARTVLVASLRADEGAATTIAWLAQAAARLGRRVAVVDLDLRSAAVSRALGLAERAGAAEVARGDAAIAEALVPVAAATGTAGGAPHREVSTLPAGHATAHPVEILGAPGLTAALDGLEQDHELVLVAVPPLLEAPDAAMLAGTADALVLVVDRRRAKAPVLADGRRHLADWPLAKLGFVLAERRAGRAASRPLSRRAPSPRRAPATEPPA